MVEIATYVRHDTYRYAVFATYGGCNTRYNMVSYKNRPYLIEMDMRNVNIVSQLRNTDHTI